MTSARLKQCTGIGGMMSVIIGVLLVAPMTVHAQNEITYTPLQPLPNVESPDDITLASYLEAIFEISIGIAGILAVLVIAIGGVEYMTTEAYTGKSAAKDKILRALGGFVLILASWIILNTINPALLNLDLDPSAFTPGEGGPPDVSTKVDTFRQTVLEDNDWGEEVTNDCSTSTFGFVTDLSPNQIVINTATRDGEVGNACRDNGGEPRLLYDNQGYAGNGDVHCTDTPGSAVNHHYILCEF